MVVVCPECRQVVHTSQGYILIHGSTSQSKFNQCAASNSTYGVSYLNQCSDYARARSRVRAKTKLRS